MKLTRIDVSRVVLGSLIALVIFLTAVTPAHCQSTTLPAWNDGDSGRASIDLVSRVTTKGGIRPIPRTALVPGSRPDISF